MGDGPVRVGIFHRHRLLRESLACYLSQIETISVVWVASECDPDYPEFCARGVDVILLEFDATGSERMNVARQLRVCSPESRILIIDVPDSEAAILSCIEGAGASGYLLQDASADDLVRTIAALARGETLCSPRIVHMLFSRVSALANYNDGPGAEYETALTRREREIIALIERGLCNKEIAVQLSIEVQTVKNHVHNILDKLQLQDRREAARYARERGLLARGH